MTYPGATYGIKGHEIKERQLFVRAYYVQREPHTGTYFIEGGQVFYHDADSGETGPCNFSVGFLNTRNTKSIEPLDEFYSPEMEPAFEQAL